jgi:hypothetical protein
VILPLSLVVAVVDVAAVLPERVQPWMEGVDVDKTPATVVPLATDVPSLTDQQQLHSLCQQVAFVDCDDTVAMQEVVDSTAVDNTFPWSLGCYNNQMGNYSQRGNNQQQVHVAPVPTVHDGYHVHLRTEDSLLPRPRGPSHEVVANLDCSLTMRPAAHHCCHYGHRCYYLHV